MITTYSGSSSSCWCDVAYPGGPRAVQGEPVDPVRQIAVGEGVSHQDDLHAGLVAHLTEKFTYSRLVLLTHHPEGLVKNHDLPDPGGEEHHDKAQEEPGHRSQAPAPGIHHRGLYNLYGAVWEDMTGAHHEVHHALLAP